MDELHYIIESYINGQKKQAKSLLNDYQNKIRDIGSDIAMVSEIFGYTRTVVILSTLGILDVVILNSFHDHNADKLEDISYALHVLKNRTNV